MCFYPAQHQIQTVVTDGTAVKHTKCGQGDCKNPMKKSAGYCQDHIHLKEICAVVQCSKKACIDMQTCTN